MKKVYVIIVTYNGVAWIKKVLTSLKNSDYPLMPIVIDNGSKDGTQDCIKNFFPDVRLVQSEKNLGFGAANNWGIKIALDSGADYIFLLNQDAYIFKGSIRSTLNILSENENVGIVSPIHFAGNEIDLDFAFYTYIQPKSTPSLIGDLISKVSDKKFYETQFVNAAAWVGRANVFNDLGGFHPVFTHYGEDMEYAIRLKKNNLMLCIDPNFLIVHDRLQNRVDNPYFQGYLSLERHILMRYFKEEKTNYFKITISYMKVLLTYLIKFQFISVYKTISSFFKTIKLVQALKKSS